MKISEKELISIKEIASQNQVLSAKLKTYAQNCQDQEVKQTFTQAANDARESANNLIQMLC
jgi:hypothetical protein